MASGGQIRTIGGKTPAHRNWARVVASWFVVFFIVASWSILFRTVSPLLFGSDRGTTMILTMNGPTPGDLCAPPLGPNLGEILAEGRQCDVILTAPPS